LAEETVVANAVLGAEDFSFFQEKVPGVFFWVGTRPKDKSEHEVASNHSPRFFVDETGLLLGVRSMANVALDYLARD
ncbi:MAG: amidohydrolase, partial [Thermoanaerobaculia bacterium]